MENDENAQENRVRGMANQQGLALIKLPPRVPTSATPSRYGLADQYTGRWIFGVGSLTLREIGEYLDDRLA
jgi:hypothetical protein